MKSITITTHRSINFGAALQAYALQQFQIQNGIENRILDVPAKKTMYEKPRKLTTKSGLITMYSNFVYFVHKKSTKKMLNNFSSFVDQNLHLTRAYGNCEEIEEAELNADFLLNGSDQVFGVRGSDDKLRMMDFGDHSIPRISYAASLGEYDWNDEEKELFKERIRHFAIVSVREQYAKEYLEPMIEKPCEVNIDPVFLLQQKTWDTVITIPKNKEPYILCYPLVSNELTQEVIDKLKEKTGLKVVCIHILPMKRIKADEYIFCAGPSEFLGLMKNAEYVVTSSFHGTAFSIIFHKKFFTLIKQYKSQRMTDLLKMLGLSNRIYRTHNDFTLDDVNFLEADKILEIEKNRAKAYFDRVAKYINGCNIEGH